MTHHLPDADQFAVRVIQDAIKDATADYWLRRAQQLEEARPRHGVDYTGAATPEDLTVRDRRLAAMAQACRNRSSVSDLNLLAPFETDLLTDLMIDCSREPVA